MFKKLKTGISMTGDFYRQELGAILRDPGALLILWGALIIYPLTYAFAYKPELIRQIKTIVVDLDNTATSRQLIRMIDGTEQIDVVTRANSMDEARQMFYAENAGGIVVITQDFERDLLAGRQADVSVYADGSYFLIYRQVINGAVTATGTFSAGVEIKKLMAAGKPYGQALQARDPLSADLHYWFNPSSGYGSFLMPGMILIILQQTLLIGIGMMGGTRKEKGQHKELVPVALKRGGIFPVLFGRTLNYLTIYFVNCLITLVWIYNWFGYPDKASLLHVSMLILPFLLSVIFLGITISVFFKRRESSLLFLVFMSPAVFFLSGISWPATSVPGFLYALAHVFPSTLVVPAYLRLRIMGVSFQDIRHEYLLLLLQCAIYFITAVLAICFEVWHTKKQDETVRV
jgi:ABC-2 type transport system permease protein